MQYESSPNAFLTNERQPAEVFDIEASDHEITVALKNRISDSEKWYNTDKRFKLASRRKKNEQLLWGDVYDTGVYPMLMGHSNKYQENQIYNGIQTIVSYATARQHQVEARPQNDTIQGRMLARDFEKFAEAHGTEHDLTGKLERVVWHLSEKRVGVVKMCWQPNYRDGRGEIVPEVIDPECIIIDHTAKHDDNPGFIAQRINDTIQNIIQRFPDKQDAIYESCGIKKGTLRQLHTRKDYYEVWLTGKDEQGLPEEQLVCFFGDVVLLKTRNPHFLYDIEADVIGNIMRMPPKPYLFLNLLNDGNRKIDRMSLVELVEDIQHTINRRKRSIAEQAEKFAGFKVFGAGVDKGTVEELSGAPGESLVVDSDDVRNAVVKISPDFIPQFFYTDVDDMRQTLHSILGTPPQLRGDNADSDTLGEALMVRDQAEGRMGPLVRALDRLMNEYFTMLLHFMKVYYTEEHWQALSGEDGTYEYVMMTRDRLADGMDLRVKAGSNQPFDRARSIQVALKLASMDMIDPLTLFEDLNLPQPQKRFERLIKWKVDPTLLAKDLREDEGDRTAHMDFEVIMAGKQAPPREDPQPEHIATHRMQMMSDEFQRAPIEVRQALIMHVQQEMDSLKRRALAMEADLAAREAQAQPVLPPAGPGAPNPGPQLAPPMV